MPTKITSKKLPLVLETMRKVPDTDQEKAYFQRILSEAIIDLGKVAYSNYIYSDNLDADTTINSTTWTTITQIKFTVPVKSMVESYVHFNAQGDTNVSSMNLRFRIDGTVVSMSRINNTLGVQIQREPWSFCTPVSRILPGSEHTVDFQCALQAAGSSWTVYSKVGANTEPCTIQVLKTIPELK